MTGVAILFWTLGLIVILQCLNLLRSERIARRVRHFEQKESCKYVLSTILELFTKQDSKTGNEVIHCKTKEQFKHVLNVFEAKGRNRKAGQKPTTRYNYWDDNQGKTTIEYNDRFCFGYLEYSEKLNFKIISYEDFLKREGLSNPAQVKKETRHTSKPTTKKPAPKKPVKRSKK